MSIFSRVKWNIVDCISGNLIAIEKLPFDIGSATGAHLRLNGSGILERHCAINQMEGGRISIVKTLPEAQLCVDGQNLDAAELTPYSDHSIKIGSHLLVIRGDKNPERWRNSFTHQAWLLYPPGSSEAQGPMSISELRNHSQLNKSDPQSIAVIRGLEMGFYLWQILESLSSVGTADASAPTAALEPDTQSAAPPVAPAAYEALFSTQPDHGALTCPVCWLRFDTGDVVHIAVHESLRGDPKLGTDAMLRFHATHFDDRLRALDPRGIPCTEIACPHCHRALPEGFLDTPHHILSIVGDQSAGKSYYLSVLIHQLPICLVRQFEVRFHDSDPAGNAMLNAMKSTLFGARTPEEAKLAKTQLEGAMYEKLPRHGRLVALPKPFVYHLESAAPTSHPKSTARGCSVIFYDNAGEHFQPGRDSAESPGAQHIASSKGIFFLFDPFNSPEFRRRMAAANVPDPQMEKPPLDQQDIILSEMRIRISRLLNLGLSGRTDTPLSIVIGKCDAWLQLLDGQGFRNPLGPEGLLFQDIQYNSNLVRKVLMDIAPKIVANAEGISNKVMYFPVSSFGHTPVRTQSGDCVPDPKKLNPIMTEIPALWMLSQIVPDLVHLS